MPDDRRQSIPPEQEAHVAGARPWGPQAPGLLRRTIVGGARLLGGAGARRAAAGAPSPARPAGPPPAVAPPAAGPPPFPRQHWSDRLWGEGMALPGGAAEVLRLAALLPLAPEATLLLAGRAASASGAVVIGARGCFVAAFDPDPSTPGQPQPKRGKLTAAPFDARAPAFRPRFHHHAMLLEPMRGGGAPAGLLTATAGALRPGGQVVLVDLVARGAPAGRPEDRWLLAEGRGAPPPAEAVMTDALRDAGFQVHVVEDAGPRHRVAVLRGWRALLGALAADRDRPGAPAAAALVAEAEAWLLRLRLMQDGRLRLLRWHASVPGRPG